MGKYACEFDAFIVLGHGPEGDVVGFSGLIIAAGVVVAAAFAGSGTI